MLKALRIKYTLNAEEVKECEEYSTKQNDISYSLYKKRGSQNKEDSYYQILVGKFAEIACYKILKQKFDAISYPDFNIYTKTIDKKYLPDLTSKRYNFHIKNCDGKTISWLFQKSDTLTTKPAKNDLVILCHTKYVRGNIANIPPMLHACLGVPNSKNLPEVEIIYFISADECRQFYKEPYCESQRKSKCAIYDNDVKILFKQ
jgi:hypothetical protein